MKSRIPTYPKSRRSTAEQIVHGTRIPNPYDWLAGTETPEIAAWSTAQTALTDDVIGNTKESAQLQAWLNRLLSRPHSFRIAERGSKLFYVLDDATRDQPALFVRDGKAEPRLLFDPNASGAGRTLMQSSVTPSPDGAYVSLASDEAGSDAKSFILIETATGRQIDGVSPLTILPTTSWHPNGEGFFYNLNQGEFIEPAKRMRKPQGIYWHRVGQPYERDTLVCTKTWEDAHVALPSVTEDGKFLFVSENFITAKKNKLLLYPLTGSTVGTPLTLIEGGEGYAIHLGDAGNESFFQTDLGGLEFGEIVAIDCAKPQRAYWRRVVAQQKDAMAMGAPAARSPQAIVTDNRLYVTFIHDAHHRIAMFDLAGKHLGDVPLPVVGSVAGYGGERYGDMSLGNDGALLVEFWTHTHRQLPARYTPKTNRVEWLFPQEIDKQALSTPVRQVFYASGDGTRIPMFLIGEARRGQKQPVLLYGYGGFAAAITPEFSPDIPAWLKLGGLYAIANIRGGSEYGKAWHDAGRRLNKQNSFDDFCAAARYLIAEGFAKPESLAIRGLSNGGLLTGACLTQHPELFGAVISELPLLDPLSMGSDAWSAALEPELGNPIKNKSDYDAIRPYSPLQNLGKHKHYPPTFVAVADRDSQQLMDGARKFAATLQAIGGGPHLLRLVHGCGHTGWPRSATAKLIAEELAFLAHTLDADFDFTTLAKESS